MQAIHDRIAPFINGMIMIIIFVAIWACVLLLTPTPLIPFAAIPMGFATFFLLSGFTIVQPNEGIVLTFFGKYLGTLKDAGFTFTIPFCSKKRIPFKLINFVTDHLKVNDLNGNPIEIGGVIMWRVEDAAQAAYNVDDYRTFVANQSDVAIRTLAAHYPYDSEKETSLRANLDEVAAKLKNVLQEKLGVAGIIIEETRLSHLAYAPEIAMAMLKRQQAVAIFQARQYMVENALVIIDEVMKHLDQNSNIKISDDKKVELINSLLIVMTSDKESTPVLSVG